MPPLRHRAVGGPFFARAKNDLRLPRQRTDPVGGVRLAGLWLDALPHSCGVATFPLLLVQWFRDAAPVHIGVVCHLTG